MPDQTIPPLVERLRAQAARHRENAIGIGSAVLMEEAADALEARDSLLDALEGVVRVADRKTDEFDSARAAISRARRGLT